MTSADLSGYLTVADASVTYVKKNDVSTLEESFRVAAAAISALDNRATALDSSVTAIEADYVKSNDISTFITAADVPDVSAKVESSNKSVMNILSISQADFNALATKDASTLYIVL